MVVVLGPRAVCRAYPVGHRAPPAESGAQSARVGREWELARPRHSWAAGAIGATVGVGGNRRPRTTGPAIHSSGRQAASVRGGSVLVTSQRAGLRSAGDQASNLREPPPSRVRAASRSPGGQAASTPGAVKDQSRSQARTASAPEVRGPQSRWHRKYQTVYGLNRPPLKG